MAGVGSGWSRQVRIRRSTTSASLHRPVVRPRAQGSKATKMTKMKKKPGLHRHHGNFQSRTSSPDPERSTPQTRMNKQAGHFPNRQKQIPRRTNRPALSRPLSSLSTYSTGTDGAGQSTVTSPGKERRVDAGRSAQRGRPNSAGVSTVPDLMTRVTFAMPGRSQASQFRGRGQSWPF
jgi:hypothetical protein